MKWVAGVMGVLAATIGFVVWADCPAPGGPTPPSGGGATCAAIVAANPGAGIIFCEDFENPGYPFTPGQAMTTDWLNRWGPGGSFERGNCLGPANPCPNGLPANFTLTSVGQCGGAAGESGSSCVFSGSHSYGAIHNISFGSGDRVGVAGFPLVKNFGITMALRFSPTFINPPGGSSGGCGHEAFRNSYKMDRVWGEGGGGASHEVWGFGDGVPGYCTSETSGPGNAPDGEVNFPYASGWDIDVCGTPSAPCVPIDQAPTTGTICVNDVHANYVPNQAVYHWPNTPANIGPGNWVCKQLQYTNWGSNGASVTDKVNGITVFNVSGIPMSNVRGADKTGINSWALENYINGCYPSATTAARFQDNIVITNGAPLPCSAIGF